MSATQDPPKPPANSEARNAYEAFRNAEVGDEVLFGDRKEPLTVASISHDDGRHRLSLEGPRGGMVVVHEEYVPGSGEPAYRSGRGEEANDLRIVNRGTDDVEGGSTRSDPRGQASKTTLRDRGDGDRAAAWERADVRPDDAPGHPWPTTPTDSTEEDLDEFAYDTTEDPMTDARDLFEGTIEGGPVRDTNINPVDEYGTYSFVDELLQFGQDVPKSVNNWVLVEYGIIDANDARRVAWLNPEDEELLVLGGIREADDAEPQWFVWHVRDPDQADARDPAVNTRDPYEALDVVADVLYNGSDQVDLSIEEDEYGNITIKDSLSDDGLGERVLSQLAGFKRLPGMVGSTFDDPTGDVPAWAFAKPGVYGSYRAGQAVGGKLGLEVDYPDGFGGWARDTSDNIIDYFNENKGDFGKLIKFGLVYSAVAASRRIASAGIGPIIEEEKLGVYVDSKYIAQDVGDLPIPYITTALSVFQNDSSSDAGGFEIDSELYVNPSKFDFGAGPVTEAGLTYERLVDISEVLNLDELELNVPGAKQIRSLRVAEDEEGNVKVIRDEDMLTGSGMERTDTRRSGSPTRSSGGGGRDLVRTRGATSFSDMDHGNPGEPSGAHKRRLRQEFNNAGDERLRRRIGLRYAAAYTYMVLEATRDDIEYAGVTADDTGQIIGEYRNEVGDIYRNYDVGLKEATNSRLVADVISDFVTDNKPWTVAARDAISASDDMETSDVEPQEGPPDDGGDGGGGSAGTPVPEEAAQQMEQQGVEEMSKSLSDIAEETQSDFEEKMQRAAATGEVESLDTDDYTDRAEMLVQTLQRGSNSELSTEDWTVLAAVTGEATKAGIKRWVADNWDTETASVKLPSDYTTEEKREGEMTDDFY